ncbi:MAG TPA: hypothetical protein VH720_01360 [Candidatus Limnocylindrales bacterium]|jgi:hypothetical protein
MSRIRPITCTFGVAAALLVGLVGCNAAVPSASPSASRVPTIAPSTASPSAGESVDPNAIYAEINAQVQAIRGLEEKEPIQPSIVSPETFGQVLEKSIRENSPPELLAAYERLYKGMDLLEDASSLEDLYVDLLQSQAAGLYDPASKKLYVLSREGAVGAVEKVYYSHEYEHALQDQHFDLRKLTDGLTDQTDRQLARQALVEGDAYTVMTVWLTQNLGLAEILEIVQAGDDPETQAALDRIPPIIKEQILFSALQGTTWVQGLQLAGGWQAIDEAFAQPPESTEQILHADKWASFEPPVEVTIPDDVTTRMGQGWSETLQDTFGERQLAVWLGPEHDGDRAAAGWGGDRVVLLDGPDDSWAIALVSEWDDSGEARDFADAATARLDAAAIHGSVVHQPGRTSVTVLFASDDAVAVGLDRIFGNTGV